MYKALIDLESVKNPHVIENLQVIEKYSEHWPGEEVENIIVAKVSLEDDQLQNLLHSLTNEWLDNEWYAVLWNEKEVYVVFQKKILKLQNVTPWQEKEFQAIVDYGEKHKIDKKYFDHIRDTMNNW